jgi:hypothetical protein
MAHLLSFIVLAGVVGRAGGLGLIGSSPPRRLLLFDLCNV